MRREREAKEEKSTGLFDNFRSFGGFGPQRSMMSGIFGGRDPFDNPFFTHPIGSLFGSSMFSSGVPSRESPQVSSSKGPVIEELLTDDEEEQTVDEMGEREETYKAKENIGTNIYPYIEHPDDKADVHPGERNRKDVTLRTNYNNIERPKPQAKSVSFQKVTYGGINGAYYTATTTRRAGHDGVVLEECKQADRTTGEAAHRISRGIHDKGHSVTRMLNSDGKVDTLQTLHNLNEDDLAGFEQSWKGNAERHLSGWDDGLKFNNTAGASSNGSSEGASMSGWALPFESNVGRSGRIGSYNEARTSASGGRPKKVVQINID